jgi:GMP synthase-like glutamine amidotransferase
LKITPIKIAVIDLYNNEPNEGMRCIQDIIKESNEKYGSVPVKYKIFDTRFKDEIPDENFDIYISSGGPGSPFDGEGSLWEKKYFNLIDKIWTHNKNSNLNKKHVFFICHSFQMMARYFKFGEVQERNSYSFGIFPVHKTKEGKEEFLFQNLPDPFYAADFRGYQVIQPNEKVIEELGAKLLALEKIRPHVDYERAIMSIRISDQIIGTQFHPEADRPSMYYHFKKPERKEQIVSKYGENKYNEMLELLERQDTISLTRENVLPLFIKNAVNELRPELISVE